MFQYSLTERTVPVPVSVPGKQFRSSGSAFGSWENGSDGSSGSVPGPPCKKSIMCKWTRPFWGRELEGACRLSMLRDAVTVPTVCFSGALRGSPEGVSSSLQPKPSASICSV